MYQPREAQGGPRDGPGKLWEGPREGLREVGRVQAGPRTAQGGHREGSWPREGMRETGK